MTKVQIEFALARPLDESHLDRIAAVHGVYGIQHVRLGEDGLSLSVEYDASRLSAGQVEAEMFRAGLPVRRVM